jgi:hypothetical protein
LLRAREWRCLGDRDRGLPGFSRQQPPLTDTLLHIFWLLPPFFLPPHLFPYTQCLQQLLSTLAFPTWNTTSLSSSPLSLLSLRLHSTVCTLCIALIKQPCAAPLPIHTSLLLLPPPFQYPHPCCCHQLYHISIFNPPPSPLLPSTSSSAHLFAVSVMLAGSPYKSDGKAAQAM